MRVDKFKARLGRIKERIEAKKRSEGKPPTKLTELFKRRHDEKREAITKEINYAVREQKKSERIRGAVGEYFDHIPQQTREAVRGASPNTIKRLFGLAQKVSAGEYGEKLKDEAESLSNRLLNFHTILSLLLIHVSLSSTKENYPEIFKGLDFKNLSSSTKSLRGEDIADLVLGDPEALDAKGHKSHAIMESLLSKIEVERGHQMVFAQLFRGFLTNLFNPSHVTVGLLLENEKPGAVETAFSLENPTERSKSLQKIVSNRIYKGEVDDAINLVKATKKTEGTKPLTNLIDQLLSTKRADIEQLIDSGQVDRIIKQAKAVKDPEEHDKIIQRLVVGLARSDLVEKAMEVVTRINDGDTRDFARSSVVSILASKRMFDEAMEVLSTIESPDYREDANGYLIKGLLDDKQEDKAIAFVESFEDPVARANAAKIILSGMVATHDAKRVEEVRTKFSLTK